MAQMFVSVILRIDLSKNNNKRLIVVTISKISNISWNLKIRLQVTFMTHAGNCCYFSYPECLAECATAIRTQSGWFLFHMCL